jgi:hypothetical protein
MTVAFLYDEPRYSAVVAFTHPSGLLSFGLALDDRLFPTRAVAVWLAFID